MAEKLTKTGVTNFKYEGRIDAAGRASRDARWDSEIPGFGVRVYPPVSEGSKPRKSYIFSYRIGGRKRLGVLGTVGGMTLDEARKKAR
ncbi:MAG: DUF4102 domain-containing protein, partial [Rhodospirillaceae bacterium]|nr:DUF4102 domain-containing protein [Rhodospirillaceae bacterium]